LTNQKGNDTIISQIIPTIDKEGDKIDAVHKIRKKKTHPLDAFSLYGSMGFYILVPILAGIFVGTWLDKKFNMKPTFTLSLLGIGVISGFYNLIRTLKTK